MGRISARRDCGDSTDPHSVGNVPMTPNALRIVDGTHGHRVGEPHNGGMDMISTRTLVIALMVLAVILAVNLGIVWSLS